MFFKSGLSRWLEIDRDFWELRSSDCCSLLVICYLALVLDRCSRSPDILDIDLRLSWMVITLPGLCLVRLPGTRDNGVGVWTFTLC